MIRSSAFILACLVFSSLGAETQTPKYTSIESEVSYPILTPSLQERKTEKLQLENGMQIYLISDPEIDQSAASMSVEAGSWQDPEKYPGMAHFLEHMLFMGNEAYPDESEYAQYIQDHGGSLNAFTAPDRTVYMFSINNSALAGALDRFSHFFIDPLFNPSCIDRELLAVDQENSKNIENDSWREFMVLKETSNPKHPNRKFSTGNAETLAGIPQDALKSWYETHYSADKMHLILLSNLPLDKMKALAIQDFSSVPKRALPSSPKISEPVLSSEQKGHFIYIKPVKDLKSLSLLWELPKEFASVDEKAAGALISYALEQASSESLIQELKREGLAESLSASTEKFGQGAVFFDLGIKLTNKGISQIDTVILRCFQALARLRQNGLPLEMFQEIQLMAQIEYQYQSREEPFSWITGLARAIVDEDLASFPQKTLIPESFDPQSISKFLQALTPEACAYFVTADPAKSKVETNRLEKWYGVEYTTKPISSAKLLAWQQAAPNPNIQMPPSNPFVLSAVPSPKEAGSQPQEGDVIIPKLLAHSDQCKIYYAEDTEYLVPESSLSFNLKTPAMDGSAKAYAMMDLFAKCLKQQLDSTLFFAVRAGLMTSFAYTGMEFSLHVGGFSEKAPELTKQLFEALSSLEVSEEHFELYKHSLETNYSNSAYELPIRQANQLLASTLLNDAPLPEEKLKALKPLSYDEFCAFKNSWLSACFCEGMIYGSLPQAKAQDLTKTIGQQLSAFAPYPEKQQKKQQFLVLPSQKGPFKIKTSTDRQGFATLLAIQEGPFSFQKKASQQIVSKALHEAFYKTLRTQQQTGYIAQSNPAEIESQLLHTFMVQSSSYAAEDLLYRFELFLSDFTRNIQEIIPKERFTLLQEAQVSVLEMPPENLETMALRLKTLAFDYNADFQRIPKRIASLKKLSYEEFLSDVQGFFSKENPHRLAILVRGEASGKPFLYQAISQSELEKLGTFTSSP